MADGEITYSELKPPPGSAPSGGPWRVTDDGTVFDRHDRVVCVLGCPDEALNDQDATNGAAILALLELLKALAPFRRFADSMEQLGHDADVKHMIRKLTPADFRAARTAVLKAEGRSDG